MRTYIAEADRHRRDNPVCALGLDAPTPGGQPTAQPVQKPPGVS